MKRALLSGELKSFCRALSFALVISFNDVQAACPPPPVERGGPGTTGILDGFVTEAGTGGEQGSVGIGGSSRFIVAFEDAFQSQRNQIFVQRFEADGTCVCISGDECPGVLTAAPTPPNEGRYDHVSIVVGPPTPIGPHFWAAWEAQPGGFGIVEPSLVSMSNPYPFDAIPFSPPKQGPSSAGFDDRRPSAGLSNDIEAATWAGILRPEPERGLLQAVPDLSVLELIRCCGDPPCPNADGCLSVRKIWNPCMSMRADGYYVIVWEDK